MLRRYWTSVRTSPEFDSESFRQLLVLWLRQICRQYFFRIADILSLSNDFISSFLFIHTKIHLIPPYNVVSLVACILDTNIAVTSCCVFKLEFVFFVSPLSVQMSQHFTLELEKIYRIKKCIYEMDINRWYKKISVHKRDCWFIVLIFLLYN